MAHREAGKDRSDFVERTIALLVELEGGHEERKAYSLATEYVGEHLARVLNLAAAIPIGYVTSYGNIAKASHVEARDVGRIMASNPLYPIVPCHRVVGADLSLVGYSGSRGPAARRAKLARLSSEARGFTAERDVLVGGGPLRVYPVEWAIATAETREATAGRQRTLFGLAAWLWLTVGSGVSSPLRQGGLGVVDQAWDLRVRDRGAGEHPGRGALAKRNARLAVLGTRVEPEDDSIGSADSGRLWVAR